MTYVITSFNDSIALSRVILSGFSSAVCFLISTIKKIKEIKNPHILQVPEKKFEKCKFN